MSAEAEAEAVVAADVVVAGAAAAALTVAGAAAGAGVALMAVDAAGAVSTVAAVEVLSPPFSRLTSHNSTQYLCTQYFRCRVLLQFSFSNENLPV